MRIKFIRFIHLTFSLAIILLTAQISAAQIQNPKQLAVKTDEYLKLAVKFEQFSGTVLIARNGVPLVNRGYGMADYELGVPNTPQTVFRIASLTKQFTATAVLQLQERGQLNVNDAICKYLEDCPKHWQAITIRQLLTHTSGIPNFSSLDDWDEKLSVQTFERAEFVKLFRELPLQFPAGERFRYSNSGYFLLGLIIEKASGRRYEDFLKETIFAPLGMKNTRLYDPRPLTPNLATGYYWSLGSFVNAPYHSASGGFANGGLVSTAADLLLWDQALYTNQILSQKSLNEMFTPEKNNYGYGWIIEKKFNRPTVGHGGSFNGFSSFFLRFPDERVTIIVLSNSDETSATKTANNLSAIVFGETYKLPILRISDVMAAKLVEKGLEPALQIYRELKRAQADKYDFREHILDEFGWDLIENKRITDAIEVFKLNLESFPQSANAYDSLGEAYLLNKNYDLSLANFKKFLELAPDSNHAKEMVKKVEETLKTEPK